jgi:hypothetical protein
MKFVGKDKGNRIGNDTSRDLKELEMKRLELF